jgi:glutamate-ammonia-ligase adenylyltransferase
MRHGADRRVRTPDTATALAALRKGNYVSLSHFQALDAGYKFLRRLEQRIVVLNGSGNTVVTRELPGLAQLARRMGLEDTPHKRGADELIDRYADVTARVRAAYLAVLGLDA